MSLKICKWVDRMNFEKKTEALSERFSGLLKSKHRIIVAIDGRCASGKTTLSARLGAMHPKSNIFHMDDFFLRPEQRTPQRLSEVGGNVDYERFLKEVLLPLYHGRSFSYRPFDCGTMQLSEPINVMSAEINIVEGSYSCHPLLRGYYDLRLFLDIEPDEQLRRIAVRNGSMLDVFRDKWIPLEELYFEKCGVAECCEKF